MKNYWMKIPLSIRKELTSGAITFVSVFMITVGETLQMDRPASWAAVIAIAGVALRAGMKSMIKTAMVIYEGKGNDRDEVADR